jgi:hypothetical protein
MTVLYFVSMKPYFDYADFVVQGTSYFASCDMSNQSMMHRTK